MVFGKITLDVELEFMQLTRIMARMNYDDDNDDDASIDIMHHRYKLSHFLGHI